MEGDAVIEMIRGRRSVREGYLSTPVPTAILHDVIACALAAPSSKNAQPWRLHVVVDRPTLDTLAESIRTANGIEEYVPWDPRTGRPYPQYRSTVVESADVLLAVPAAVFIENLGPFSGGRDALAQAGDAIRDSLAGYGFELIGIGAAVENMLIAAIARGLSAVFMGDVVIADHAVREHLGFAGDLAGVVALGYSAAQAPPPMDVKSRPDLDRAVWH